MKPLVIAIDGYSSTGKSSISKLLAQKLGLIHIDTGALYRGVTWYALENCKDESGEISKQILVQKLDQIHLEFIKENDKLVLYLNQKNIEEQIRNPIISDWVSWIAKQPEVREYLLETQRKISKKTGVVMDGRDIGTVVLPNADFKFFLTASIEERSKRRFLELQNLGYNTPFEEVKKNLITRDKIDSEREIAPLIKAEDAILIDNSTLSKEETLKKIISYLK